MEGCGYYGGVRDKYDKEVVDGEVVAKLSRVPGSVGELDGMNVGPIAQLGETLGTGIFAGDNIVEIGEKCLQGAEFEHIELETRKWIIEIASAFDSIPKVRYREFLDDGIDECLPAAESMIESAGADAGTSGNLFERHSHTALTEHH